MSDETWAAYGSALGATPVSVGLGKLVEREVARHRWRTAVDAVGVQDAVEDARAVARELAALISRPEPVTEPTSEREIRASRGDTLFD